MDTKKTIRKVLFVMLWVCIGGGMLSLLIAAIGKKNREDCTGYTITIKGAAENYFIDAEDVNKLLKSGAGFEIKGKKISEINLKKLEHLLRNNIWIRKAEMWFIFYHHIKLITTVDHSYILRACICIFALNAIGQMPCTFQIICSFQPELADQ